MSTHTTECSKQFFITTELIDPPTDLLETMSPFALGVKANSADTPNWYQAMNGPLADGYWKAMEAEIKTLEDKNLGL